jgi:4-amino-4-deoxy-L-arabinose transferase-like glycosyltransferase
MVRFRYNAGGMVKASGLLTSIRQQRQIWLATGLILLFFFLAIDSLIDDSPTMDEQNHIARGVAFLRTGDPRLSLEHPPLINSLSALLLLTLPDLRLPIDHPSWERREGWYEFAELFLWQYNHDVSRIVFLARIPVVFLLIALALSGFRFALQTWGGFAGVVALGLILFEPNLMAHGRFATTDIGGTLFTFVATYSLWNLWQDTGRWNWQRWIVVALLMGLAFGSKLSSLGFVFIWLLLAILPLYPKRNYPVAQSYWRSALFRVSQLVSAGLVSLLVVWAIFGFEWGPNKFTHPSLSLSIGRPIPMPTYWAGLEQIALLTGEGRLPAFLLGKFSEDGFWAYFPVAFLAKTPVLLLGLFMIGGFLLLRNRHTRRKAIFLLVPTLSFFLITMQSALNIGYRHVLPALPYLLVLVSGLASRQLALEFSGKKRRFHKVLPGTLAGVGLLSVIVASLWIHPNYLSYFNLAVGGPANGYRILTDSNVDWGQDLLRLKSWMAKNDVEEINLGWFGSADPDYYEINHNPLPGIGRDRYFQKWWDVPFNRSNPEPGIYAISAASLWEIPSRPEEKTVYAWFRNREPDDRVGYSILIYDVQ